MNRCWQWAVFVLLATSFSQCQKPVHLLYNPVTGFDTSVNYGVFIFVDNDCPLCKGYRPLISKIDRMLADKKDWRLVTVRTHMTDVATKPFSKHEVFDGKHKLVDWFHATVTPEAVIVNSESAVLYRGALDDYSYETGKHRSSARLHYLLDAISAIESGDTSYIGVTQPVGCFIENL